METAGSIGGWPADRSAEQGRHRCPTLAVVAASLAATLALGGIAPAQAPGRGVPDDYRELARAMSNEYGIDGQRPAPKAANLPELMDRLGKSRNPAVKAAAEQLQDGRKNAVEAARQVQAGADAARRLQQSVYDDAANGVYSREQVREQVITNSDGTTRVVRTTETVDDSGLPVFGATLLNGWVQANAPEQMRKRAAAAMESARLEAWLKLVDPKTIRTVYPDTRVRPKSVTFRITAPDAAANRKAKFEAVNASGAALTDVTLSVVLVHFTTAPEPTVLQVYFIPRWDAGQAIQLPTAVVRNMKTTEFDLGRPVAANPAGDHPEIPASERRPWLAGPGGLTAVHATLYAAELQQPAETFPFPEQAEEGARWEIRKAAGFSRGLVTAQLRTLTKQPFPKLEDAPADKPIKIPEKLWEVRAARRVIAFAPAGSDTVRQAKLLIDNPVALLRELDARDGAATAKLVAPGTVLEGEWKFDLKGFGIGVPADVQKAASALKGASGRIALRIDAVKGEDVTATLYSPDRPEVKREVKGKLGTSGLAFPPAWTGRNAPAFNPEQLNPVKSPGGIRLRIDGTEMIGSAAGYPYPKCYEFTLAFKPAKGEAAVATGDVKPAKAESVIQKGDVWADPRATGAGVVSRIEITEVKNGSFVGEMLLADKRKYTVRGTDRGGKVTFTTDKVPGSSFTRTFTGEVTGRSLRAEWSGLGTANDRKSGKIELTLQK